MAELLPAIKLTDANNQEGEPTRPFSPTNDAPSPSLDQALKKGFERPETPTKRSKSRDTSRPGASPGRVSPNRARRSQQIARPSSEIPRDEASTNDKLESLQNAPPGIDPLSQVLFSRTSASSNRPNGRPSTSENGPNPSERTSPDQTTAPPTKPQIERTDSIDSIPSTAAPKDLRKGTKAVSFINRFMGKKKKEDESATTGGAEDNESISNEGRPEGNDAEVFQQPAVDNIGFSPQHPQPPAYIKMRAKYKKEKAFDRVFLAQELECRKDDVALRGKRQNSSTSVKLTRRKSSAPQQDANTVWAMEFSRDGKYLAAAGVDGVVSVWAVIASLDDRQKHEKQESSESEANGANPHAEHLSAPVFQRKPLHEYEGHTSTVLDLSWSKNNFLLSSSMDKTVRLWHISRSECLCTFKHNDFVPSIAFHPKDDRFFLAGSLDSRLRLWSIPDKNVAFAAQLPDMITAVAFTPDGKYSMAGCLNGACSFYETEGMKYQSQLHVRSSRGHNAKGAKITGIQAYYDQRNDIKLLITSNDSRIRLYNFRDKNLEMKFRGNENNYSQIRASISDDSRYVICGSEDRKAYIWSMGPAETERGEKRDKRPVEMFEAHNTITTAVAFAPTKTRVLLGRSEDPLYDLCNPPPVTLMSREERAQSRAGSQGSSSRPASGNGSVQATPVEFEKPKEPASYINRSSHRAGNIIVTADFAGTIKVFRQDCAWSKRKSANDDWDRGSIFGKRNGGRLSRTGSTMTRGSQRSLRDGKTASVSSVSGLPSERILSWRQGIASTPSVNEPPAAAERRKSSGFTTTSGASRNVSPSKTLEQQGVNGQQATNTKTSPSNWTGWGAYAATARPSDPITMNRNDTRAFTAQARAAPARNGSGSGGSPKSSPKDDNPLQIQGGQSYLYWDTAEWKAQAARSQKLHEEQERERDRELHTITSGEADTSHLAVQRPNLSRGRTDVSELSDEKGSRSSSADEFDDAREQNSSESPQMKCWNCGSLAFKARKTKAGSTRLCCTRCGERA